MPRPLSRTRTTSRNTRRLTPVALLLATLLALSACGNDSASGDTAAKTSAPAAFPVSVTGANGKLTLDAQPETIVSMSATSTEMLFAIGAGTQVEAADSTSNYPKDAPTTDLSAFTPNAEAIAKYNPDLVILSDDLNGIVDALGALKVPTLLLPAAKTLDDTYHQLETLGDATGHADDADKVISDVKDRISAAVKSVPDDVLRGQLRVAAGRVGGAVGDVLQAEHRVDAADERAARGAVEGRIELVVDLQPLRAGRHGVDRGLDPLLHVGDDLVGLVRVAGGLAQGVDLLVAVVQRLGRAQEQGGHLQRVE